MKQRTSEYIRCKFETRVEEKNEADKKLVVRGYPILFNTETRVYDFWYGDITERIEPTALDNTDLTDVYLITGHNMNPEKVLGRTGINMRLEKDETGVFVECELPDTQHAKDIYSLIESGLVDGMSFGFDCSDEVDPETKTRTITSIDELYEVTITPFPAYKEASIVAQKQREVVDEEIVDDEETIVDEEIVDDEIVDDEADREEKLKELEEILDD